MFLSQRRTLSDPKLVKDRSSPLLEVRSRDRVRATKSRQEKQSVAAVIKEFLSADADNLHGLETYLKGQHVQILQKQGHVLASNASIDKIIAGLARLKDGLGSKSTSPPKVTRYGGGCNDVRFYSDSCRGGRDKYITVAQYFKDQKRQRLEETDLPVINVGTRSRPVYFPSELCMISDQQLSTASEFSFGDVADFVSTATMPKWISNVNSKNDIRYPGLKQSLEMDLSACHVSMTIGSLVAPYRMRADPLLEYVKGKEVQPDAGSWKMNSVTLAPSKHRFKVAVLLIEPTQWTTSQKVVNTLKLLGSRLSHHGLTQHQIVEPHISIAMETRKLDKDMRNKIESNLKSLASHANLVVTVLPFEMKPLYDYIKSKSDIECGIHNICVIASSLASDDNGYFFHIALKVNLKSGGQNQVLKSKQGSSIKLETTMIVGIDIITPPKKTASGSKGIAAIVASSDGTLSQWPADFQVLNDKPLHEQLAHLLKSRLRLWKRKNGHQPQHVLIYHNGQLDKSCTDEVSSFREACGVHMTFIAVNKDHQAKFEPLSPSLEPTNPKFTSEDAAIIVRTKHDPRAWEFVIQSTVSFKNQKILPVRYSVVYDDIFSPPVSSREELEDLTHDMYYLSGCTTAVVGNTLPIHYVGLLCDRIGAYVRPWYHPRGKKDEDLELLEQKDITVNQKIAETMFYV